MYILFQLRVIMVMIIAINKIQWAKRLKADKHTGELCHSKEALLLDICFQRTGSWFPKSWGKRIASCLENLGCGRPIVLGHGQSHSPEYYKNSHSCKYLNSCWAKSTLRIYIYTHIYSDVFQIFIFICSGTSDNYDYVKNKKMGECASLFLQHSHCACSGRYCSSETISKECVWN